MIRIDFEDIIEEIGPRREAEIDNLNEEFNSLIEDCINKKKKNIRNVNREIVKRLNDALKNGIITQAELDSLDYRRDHRTYAEFWIYMKENNPVEFEIANRLIDVLTTRGEIASYKNYGNLDRGKPRVVNKQSKPDIWLYRN